MNADYPPSKIRTYLILFACTIFLAGCHTNRALERKDGKLSMTEVIAPSPPFHPLLIIGFGTYLPPDGFWKIDVSENSVNFAHPNSGGVEIPWNARPGWFVFVESSSKAWACDGNSLLWLYLETHAGSSNGYNIDYSISPGRFREPNFQSGYPSPVPVEVLSQLPERTTGKND